MKQCILHLYAYYKALMKKQIFLELGCQRSARFDFFSSGSRKKDTLKGENNESDQGICRL